MPDQPAQQWRTVLRAGLTDARKQRDTVRVSALRTALSAIDNAETPDLTDTPIHVDGPIAHSASGVGAAEVPRRQLDDTEIRALLRAEIDERLSAAAEFTAAGHAGRAAEQHRAAALLDDLVSGR